MPNCCSSMSRAGEVEARHTRMRPPYAQTVAGSTGAAGDLVDLEITGVAHGGVFVARHEGRVVFVPDAIPGERVRVRLTDTSKNAFWRGEALEVLDASPHRIPHVWRQADIDIPPELRPGGADFGHIALAHQRELKVQVLLESLQRIGGIDDIAVVDRRGAAARLG